VFFSLAILFFEVIAIAIADKKGEANEKKSLKDAYIISCEVPNTTEKHRVPKFMHRAKRKRSKGTKPLNH